MTGTIFAVVISVAIAFVYLYINRHRSVSKSFMVATLLMAVFSVLMFYLEYDWRHQQDYSSFLEFAIMGCSSYVLILFFEEEGNDVGMAFARFAGWLGLISSLLVVAGGRAYLKTHFDSY